MEFEDIEFEERQRGGKAEMGKVLPGGYWVAKWCFVEAWARSRATLPMLDLKRKQSTQSLCNDPGWTLKTLRVRYAFGRCIKYFVKHGMLPLYETNPGKKGPRRYLGR
jgi:hypothetical protein